MGSLTCCVHDPGVAVYVSCKTQMGSSRLDVFFWQRSTVSSSDVVVYKRSVISESGRFLQRILNPTD